MEGPGHPGDLMYGMTCVEIEDYILGSDPPHDDDYINKVVVSVNSESEETHFSAMEKILTSTCMI